MKHKNSVKYPPNVCHDQTTHLRFSYMVMITDNNLTLKSNALYDILIIAEIVTTRRQAGTLITYKYLQEEWAIFTGCIQQTIQF